MCLPLRRKFTSVFSRQVLPALAVVAGVDRGLRVGGACVHRPSSRRAVVLGMLKQGLSSVRLQWEDGDTVVRSVPLIDDDDLDDDADDDATVLLAILDTALQTAILL